MGVVPMKPPNRGHEVVAAEVVEGRPVTKENIMTANTCPTQCGTTGEPVNQSFMVCANGAARSPGRPFPTSSGLLTCVARRGASKVRTVCGSSRKHGSVRGVAGNGHPFRDGLLATGYPNKFGGFDRDAGN